VPRLVFEMPVMRSRTALKRAALRSGHRDGVHSAWAAELSFFLFAAWAARGELAAPLKGDEARETRADVRRWIRLMLPFVRRCWAAICLGNEALARAELRTVERAWTAASSGPLLSMAVKHFDNFEKSKRGGAAGGRATRDRNEAADANRRIVLEGLAFGRGPEEIAAITQERLGEDGIGARRVRQLRKEVLDALQHPSADMDEMAAEYGVKRSHLEQVVRARSIRRRKSEA